MRNERRLTLLENSDLCYGEIEPEAIELMEYLRASLKELERAEIQKDKASEEINTYVSTE